MKGRSIPAGAVAAWSLVCVAAGWLPAAAPPASGQEALDPRIPGDYRTPAGELVVVARTAARPVWFEPATGEVRVLFREDDSTFRAGPGLLVRDPVAFRVRFRGHRSGGFDRLVRERAGEPPVVASRVARWRESEVSFRSGGIELAGTLFLPAGREPGPGVVIVHGSGAQDRYGPFGYYRLMADAFARRGFAVLTFDKRGVGGSGGDWRTAGFPELAADVAAAIRWLEAHPEVRAGDVGLWGISQAGWVAAEAVRRAPRPAFVALASAAGTAIDPGEQNIYNVRAELRGRGFAEESVERAVEAWSRLYSLVAARRGGTGDPAGGSGAALSPEGRALERLVLALREDGLPPDLLPPLPSDVAWEAGDQWFLALDVGFDPLPVWRDYTGPLLAVFGGRDASTPTDRVVERLRSLEGEIDIEVFPRGDHFLLESESGTVEELPRLRRFVTGVLDAMAGWAANAAEEDAEADAGRDSGIVRRARVDQVEPATSALRSASRKASP